MAARGTGLDVAAEARMSRLGGQVGSSLHISPPPLTLYAGSFALVLLGLAAIGLAAYLFTAGELPSEGAGLALGLSGLVIAGVGVVLLARRAALRCDLQPHEHGFTVSRRGHTQPVLYEEVETATLERKEQLGNGVLTGELVRLELKHAETSIRLRHFVPAGARDSFAQFLGMLSIRVIGAVEARLQAGAVLRGSGWTLDLRGLDAGGRGPTPLGEVVAVGLFEGKVALWRASDEHPFFSTPAKGPNAWLLAELARKQIPTGKVPDVGGMGRILFQKVPRLALRLFVGVLGLLIAGGGIGLLVYTVREGDPLGIALCAALTAGLLALAFLCLNFVILRFQFYERGLTRRAMLGARSLAFDQLQMLRHSAVRQYYRGAYAGTVVTMLFEPAPGAGKPIKLSLWVHGNDADLDLARDRAAEAIAVRLLEQVKVGGEVAWGKSVRLTRDGIKFRAAKLIGKGEERFAPYTPNLRGTVQDGTFRLMLPDEPKPLSMKCGEDNFYPGLLVLGRLSAGQDRSRVA